MILESLDFLQSLVTDGVIDTFGFVVVSTPYFSEQPWKCYFETDDPQVVGPVVREASTFVEAVMLLCEQVAFALSITWPMNDDHDKSDGEAHNLMYQLHKWVDEQTIIGNGYWSISIEFLRDQNGSLVWCGQTIGYTTGEIQIDECEETLERLCEIMQQGLTDYETP